MGKGTILNQFQCLQFRTQLVEGLLDSSRKQSAEQLIKQ